MKYKYVVSNSSPLMNLAIIDALELVESLFGTIIIPEEVWQELVIEGKGKPGAQEIAQLTWVEKGSIGNIELFRLLKKDLDIGEAAAITLAIENNADLILLDETDARNVAELYSLPKTGVLGILIRAKKAHLIRKIKPLLDDLKTKANFWIKQELYEAILSEVGESHD